MIIAAPTRLAVERMSASKPSRSVGDDADLQRSGLEPLRQLAEAARHPQERLQLREAEREQLVRLEAALGLLRHHGPPLAAQHLDRVERRIERARDALGLRERLADERERRRQRDAVLQAEPLQVGERLARPDPFERAATGSAAACGAGRARSLTRRTASSSATSRGSGRRRRRRGCARSRAARARATCACRRRAGRSARSRAARAGRRASAARSRGADRRGRSP